MALTRNEQGFIFFCLLKNLYVAKKEEKLNLRFLAVTISSVAPMLSPKMVC